jgi:hypothetical protein
MGPNMPMLLTAAVMLLAAGVATANNLLAGPSPGLAVNAPTVAQSSTAASTTGTTGTLQTGVTGPSTGTPVPTATTATTTPVTPTTATTGTTTTAALAIDEVVSITRTVEAGSTAVTAFTVPAGQLLVLTDVLITNPGMTPACGGSVGVGGSATPSTPTASSGTTGTGTTTTTTPGTGGTTATNGTTSNTPTAAPTATAANGGGESGTGILCVPAQTSLNLGLTTGLEVASGLSVVLANLTTSTTTGPAGPLHFHLRGFLASPGA